MTQEGLSAKIRQLALVALAAFCLIPPYLGYWAIVRGPELRQDPYNKRAVARLALTKPGRVLSSDGEEILGREPAGLGRWKRSYPSPRTFCHLTGYAPGAALQKTLQGPLLATGRYESPWASLWSAQPAGDDVVLTIDGDGQRAARRLLDGRKGAVVALDPRTGEVLVLAGAPTYDPSVIATDPEAAELFRTDPEAPELNRALQGLYPLGSVFKLVTAAAALESGAATAKTTFECRGSLTIDGQNLECLKREGHGTLDMTQAIVQSCNVYFYHLGEALGTTGLSTYAEGTGLFQLPDVPLPAKASRLLSRRSDAAAAASLAVGQGDLLITPFAAAQIAAAISNDGLLMRPRLVKEILSRDGQVVEHTSPSRLGQAMQPATARLLAGMMEQVVETGTGRSAELPGIRVSGKTGSAENPEGEPHAWFVAFAPSGEPRVAVAVVVENGGTGGGTAAPIAREVIEALLR